MILGISARTGHRILALVLLAGVFGLLWVITVRPLARMILDRRASVERSLKLLTGYQRLAATRPSLDDQFKALKTRELEAHGLAEGGSAALAAASLQSDIKRIIESNGGEVRSAQPLPTSKSGDFEKVELRYDLSVAQASLSEIMYQIETHTPYLFLDGIDIRGAEGLPAAGQGNKEQKLTVRWTVRAFRWAGQK